MMATAIISSMSVKPALRRVLPVGPWGLRRVLGGVTPRLSLLRYVWFQYVALAGFSLGSRLKILTLGKRSLTLQAANHLIGLCEKTAGDRGALPCSRAPTAPCRYAAFARGTRAPTSSPAAGVASQAVPPAVPLLEVQARLSHRETPAPAAAFRLSHHHQQQERRRHGHDGGVPVDAGTPGYSLTMTRSRSSRGMEKVMVSARPSSSSGASAPSSCRR